MTKTTNSVVAINNLINEALRKYFIAYPEKQEGYTPVLITVDCPITVEDFLKLSNCVRNYDIFTQYIENYKQEEAANKRNKKLNDEFNSILSGYGIEDMCSVFILKSNCGIVGSRLNVAEEAVAECINELFKFYDIKVISSTLTEQNGELTFIELLPEQKLEISKVLDAQLKDVNYSSWFEEENGVFKLYGGWVDEDSAVKEEYYFNGNKLIKIEKEESTMKNNTNTTATNNSTNNKEVITMINEMIKVTVKVEGLNEVLTRYGIELICSNPSDADTIAIGQTPSQRRKGIVAVIITQTPSQYRKGIATMTIKEDVYKTIEKDLSIVSNNSATVVKEEITMRELVNNTINRIETATKVQDAEYVTRDELAGIMEQLTGVRPGKKVTRKQMVQDLYVLEDDLQQMENANGSDCDSDTVVAVGDFCNDHAPESIESDPTPVVENPAPVSDAKAKTVEVLKLIKEAAVTNHNKGFGTTVSAYMLCAYILQAGYGIKKLKGHEAEITDEQKDTVKRVRQWLIDKGYIKACVYKTNGKSVYTDDYDGNHAASMVHHSKSLGLTCVGVSSYKVCF